MTKNERSLVQKLAGMLHTNTDSSPLASAPDQRSEDDVIGIAYAVACSTGKCTISAAVDENFVRHLQLPSLLMLLELMMSRYISVVWAYKAPPVTKELLDRLCDQFMVHEGMLTFKIVWWLLVLLSGDGRLYSAAVTPAAGKRLFGLCVRRIHQLLPGLCAEQRLLVYLVLASMSGYEKPFIVMSEIEKRALATPLGEYDNVNSKVLLQFMSSPFAMKHMNLTLRLASQWCKGKRIADFDCDECLHAFSIVASLHERTSPDTAFAVASAKEWEVLHECLFAQVFLIAGELTPGGCISVLDQAEVINISGWGTTVPQLLLEKLKRRLLTECKHLIEDQDLSPEAAEDLLRVVLGLHHLLQRCTVLPYNAHDEETIKQFTQFLELRLAP
ncbi:hypothetical protein ABL78_6606 [Leptomonas seymouri]|uniref:Uncharacterized protein n=1 Tax=Leptomonas seymouri TaxID=5684 RepID=A0A0N1PBX3_LEPSE|nr:hypothetical protein ABL78_6606 [Leptomonas seymouri]|eukprot:KPI84351.1 hypothetical protein ABL78_6606 [Leptomonas seymouri]